MKTTISMNLESLIKANAKFTPAGDRAPNGVDVDLRAAASSLYLRCAQWIEDDVTVLKFQNFSADASFLDSVRKDLTRFGIVFTETTEFGALIRVRVLDLLDTHWMLVQLIGEPILKITAPDGTEHRLQFMNDGENLWAQFDASGFDWEEGARIVASFKATETKYEMLT